MWKNQRLLLTIKDNKRSGISRSEKFTGGADEII